MTQIIRRSGRREKPKKEKTAEYIRNDRFRNNGQDKVGVLMYTPSAPSDLVCSTQTV